MEPIEPAVPQTPPAEPAVPQTPPAEPAVPQTPPAEPEQPVFSRDETLMLEETLGQIRRKVLEFCERASTTGDNRGAAELVYGFRDFLQNEDRIRLERFGGA